MRVKNETEAVSDLEHWTDEKLMNQCEDKKFRARLRANIQKQIPMTVDELASEKMDSYIIDTVSQLVKQKKELEYTLIESKVKMGTMDDDKSIYARKSSANLCSPSHSPNKQRLHAKAKSSNEEVRELLEIKRVQMEKVGKMNRELMVELQTLGLRKELQMKRAERKRLYKQNTQLAKLIIEKHLVH